MLSVIAKRSDFLAAARAKRRVTHAFILQARESGAQPHGVRYGITCSKKVGNAVARNRAKRRLRAIARDVLPQEGRPGWDYVLIGRREVTAALPYQHLRADLFKALQSIHADGAS